MLAERKHPGRSTPVTRLGAALTVGVALLAAAFGSAPASAATAGAPVQVAVVVPIIVPSGTTGLIGADSLAQFTSPFGLLTRQLDATIDRPVTLAIDPMIIASIRILGTAAPESAVAWLDRLATATNDTFALAYGDGDLTLATQAGTATVLAPESLDFAIDPALFAPATAGENTPTPSATPTSDPTLTPTPTPSVTADPEVPALPTTADLLSWQYTLTGVAWPRDNTAVAADLPKITSSGYSTTILSSQNISAPTSGGPVAEVEGNRVLVSDSVASDALRTAVGSFAAEEWAASMTTLGSTIAAAGGAQTADTATVVATLGRSVPLSASRLSDTITALDADPQVTLVPLSQAMGLAPTEATVVDQPQAADRVAQASRVLAAESAVAEYSQIAADPLAITAPRRLEVLALFSNVWVSNPTGWPGVTDDFVAASFELRDSVQLVKSSKLNLIADNGQYLPIKVSNDLDQPVTVYVTARPSSGLLLVTEPRVELVIPANSQAKVDVPVRSLSNGVVVVNVALTSSAALPIGSSISTEVNVQAGWETPIVVAFFALIVLVFGFGIVRTILKRRRSRDD